MHSFARKFRMRTQYSSRNIYDNIWNYFFRFLWVKNGMLESNQRQDKARNSCAFQIFLKTLWLWYTQKCFKCMQKNSKAGKWKYVCCNLQNEIPKSNRQSSYQLHFDTSFLSTWLARTTIVSSSHMNQTLIHPPKIYKEYVKAWGKIMYSIVVC